MFRKKLVSNERLHHTVALGGGEIEALLKAYGLKIQGGGHGMFF